MNKNIKNILSASLVVAFFTNSVFAERIEKSPVLLNEKERVFSESLNTIDRRISLDSSVVSRTIEDEKMSIEADKKLIEENEKINIVPKNLPKNNPKSVSNSPYKEKIVSPSRPKSVTEKINDRKQSKSEIEELQDFLMATGFLTNTQKSTGIGKFGPQTERGLKEFQKYIGLKQTGKLDEPTRQAIAEISNGTKVRSQIGHKPEKSSVVDQIQNRLVKLDYLSAKDKATGPGIYGLKTENAILNFQQQNGLRADGIVGAKTFKALFNKKAVTSSSNNTSSKKVNKYANKAEKLNSIVSSIQKEYKNRTGHNLRVTSRYRTPERQAKAMANLIRRHGRNYVRNLYYDKNSVNEIISAYDRGGTAEMTRVIEKQIQNGIYISKHLRAEAFDISNRTNIRVLQQILDKFGGGSIAYEGDHYHVSLEKGFANVLITKTVESSVKSENLTEDFENDSNIEKSTASNRSKTTAQIHKDFHIGVPLEKLSKRERRQLRKDLENLLTEKEVIALLNAIQKAEGGNATLPVGGLKSNGKGRKSQECRDRIKKLNTSDHPKSQGLPTPCFFWNKDVQKWSLAAGNYQVTFSNWQELQKFLGLKKFSERNQAVASLELMRSSAVRGTKTGDGFVALAKGGKKNLAKASRQAVDPWASAKTSRHKGAKAPIEQYAQNELEKMEKNPKYYRQQVERFQKDKDDAS